jgi:hypothetical protein
MNREKFKIMQRMFSKSFVTRMPVNQMLVFALAGLLIFGTTSCSSQKRLARKHAKEARLAQIAQAKAELYEIINDEGFLPLEVKESKLQM